MTDSRLVIHQSVQQANHDSFAEDVRAGLTAQPKTLPPKYFYDALGSQLFEAICLLPEYYPTRAEAEIFQRHAAEIVSQLPAPIGVVELGSGSSVKTRLLIEAILAQQAELHYQPMDISASILQHSAEKLLGEYDRLRITGHVGDYTCGLDSVVSREGERLLALFLGSNIGNYTADEAHAIHLALEQTPQVDRLIHLRTQYLGPEELLVGAKIALAPTTDLATVAATIDAAEAAVRAAVPAAKVIYIEPDLDRLTLQ